MDQLNEVWKDIFGLEGKYQISNLGRVRSVERYVSNHTGILKVNSRILKQQTNHKGYRVIRVVDSGKKITKSVHRLVANAFLPIVYGKNQVNHKDGNKSNNNIENLEWCTNQENQLHAIRLGLNNHSKYDSGRKKRKVKQIDLETRKVIKIFDSLAEAERMTKTRNIGACCQGKRRSANGYAWKYESEVM